MRQLKSEISGPLKIVFMSKYFFLFHYISKQNAMQILPKVIFFKINDKINEINTNILILMRAFC